MTDELLRTLECMAASKPTSWLSGRTHILCLSTGLWALAEQSGLFPSPSAQLSRCPRGQHQHSGWSGVEVGGEAPRRSSALPPMVNARGQPGCFQGGQIFPGF